MPFLLLPEPNQKQESTGQEGLGETLHRDQSPGHRAGQAGAQNAVVSEEQTEKNQHTELQANVSPRVALNQKSYLAKYHSYPPTLRNFLTEFINV